MNASLYPETVDELLRRWDNGQSIWSVECGGLGPGYEQAIQVCAVEFARSCKGMSNMKNDDKESSRRFRSKCDERLREIDGKLGGLSGAQYGAAVWIAWQWCFNGGPAKLIERCKNEGQEDRAIQVCKNFPQAP